ncbi:DEAD/DEAH box helicase [Mobilitalea sibirica]|uniref:DEAD/DEAH box helicase n=1 Tax=Mobilitalea sibirica TaxID=1462919 RepID=A0A8J7H2Z2_9FIRM|nr:DEAD/DEAH box helicase [Mobilitalea sibirica]MBH1941055.1 DEAD/DEAH box helicase [Mobilitalea sibirica]
MQKHDIEQMVKGFETAFINQNSISNLAYKPQFISNNYKEGRKVLSSIEDELLKCEQFYISVAFITMSGLTPLLQTLKELETKGIPGQILTTDYLSFSEPKALHKLAELKNIELKMYCTDEAEEGFHTKGYIFKEDEIYKIIVGSSNITLGALTKNKEWNTKIISTRQGEFADNIVEEFNTLWNAKSTKSYSDFIESYTVSYELIKKQKAIAKQYEIPSIEQYRLQPNKMQVEFVSNLRKLKDVGEEKALLISATGTGKTYASAFALREESPKKALFVVHREQIAKQAIKSYKKVFGNTKRFGLISGTSKDYEAEYLFSTMQMMAKPEVRERFARDEFEFIIIDEVHRAGAESYKKIMEYFQPKFWLGMTASPDRTDGFDIYRLFNHKIAYEIRLQQALEENLLCPFHYFGITDLEIDGEVFDDTTGIRNFARLVCDSRVDYVIEKANYYGYSGERVKGLIFCSRKDEAKELSAKFNARGYHTEFLCGEDSQECREECIERLTNDDRTDTLDYIFTVDIFNEGVDIPEINQVIMLRPTESPIVFIQQLGRGLRKAENKEYVVILDFIGNYMNNFMIPIALSGDRTYNKDNIRRYLLEGERIIPGSSTIHFDEISKKRIFNSIDAANFSDIKLIKENYTKLKNKLGHIPSLKDFDDYGEMDVLRIFDNNSLGSYYKFLVKYEKDYKIRLSASEEKYIEFISKKLASGKRIHELELLNRMLAYRSGLIGLLKQKLAYDYNISMEEKTVKNVVNVMTNEFPSGTGKKTFEECVFLEPDGDDYRVNNSFARMLDNPEFLDILKELISFGISRNKRDYGNRYQDTNFELYQKYTYEDVCRLLEWETNEVPLNIGGYKYDSKTKTFPVFINYDKSDDIQATIKYEDHFVTPNNLIAISKSGRNVQSEDIQNFLNAQERGIKVELFVRKNKDDKISKEFYYLGRMHATGNTNEIIMANTDKTAVEIEWVLDTPVREDIYEYITK